MPYRDPPVFVWRRKSISRFESAWALFHKFSLLNVASAPDIRQLFGESHEGTNYAWGRKKGYFLALDHIDEESVARIFRLSQKDVDLSQIAPYRIPIDGAVVSDSDIISETLRYCPECISKGYHSPIHQLLYIARCPLHGIELEDLCPRCAKSLPYSFDSKILENPFGCKCGYGFWPERDSLIWPKALTEDEELVLDNYVRWISEISNTSVLRLRQLGFSTNPTYRGKLYESRSIAIRKIAGYWHQVFPIKNWNDQTFLREEAENWVTSVSGRIFKKIALVPVEWPTSYSESLLIHPALTPENVDQLVALLISTYKCIKRKIRSIILSSHLGCSRSLDDLVSRIDMSRIPPYCNLVYALKVWQHYWEGGQFSDRLPESETTHLRTAIIRAMTSFSELNRTIIPIDSTPASQQEAYRLVEWISQRIFSLILLTSFHESLRIVSNIPLDQHDTVFAGLPIDIANPYFLIGAKAGKRNVTIDWWTQYILGQLEQIAFETGVHQQEVSDNFSKYEHAHFDYLASLTKGFHENILR